MTLTPLILAQLIMDLISALVQVPENLPQSANSGLLSTTIGKLSSSVICQCSTDILLYIKASIVCLIAFVDRKCRDESIISPRQIQLGLSSIVMGRPLMQYLLSLRQKSWEKVSSPLRKPTQQSAISYHFYVVRMVSWQFQWPACSATIWLGFLTTMFILVAPGLSSLHLNTQIRYRLRICFTQSAGLASTMYVIVQGSTSLSSAVSFRDNLDGRGQRSLVLLYTAAGYTLVQAFASSVMLKQVPKINRVASRSNFVGGIFGSIQV